jgi:predicted AlkP superfamily pyrophosphatase or phosphodiesterase
MMTICILISIDGLRPDAIRQVDCPNIKKIISTGSSTMKASSVTPSITLPCHTSIFHSVPPSRHGILTNDWRPMARPVPGLIDIANQQDKRCGFFTNWENLRDLSRPGSLEYSYFIRTAELHPPTPYGDHLVAEAAQQYLSKNQLDFSFVYFGTLDVYGHLYGWMSEEYLAQLENVDSALGILLDGLPKDTTILLLSDHGGHERNHGTDSAEDMIIPWIISGPGIRSGYQIQTNVNLIDTAPTIAKILDLKVPDLWEGMRIEEIFIE